MLELSFILLAVLMATIIFIGYHTIAKKIKIKKQERNKLLTIAIISLSLWFTYVFVLSNSGILNNFDLPPRFPLLIVLPLFIFIGIFLYRHRNSEIIPAIPKSWLIYYQSFRIGIESLFVASIPYGVLPHHVTFEGYNYDIVFAATAPVVAFLAFNKKLISKKVVIAWNYLGLIVIAFIIFLFTTTVYFPSFWGSETTLAGPRFTEFPFMLVAGFLMPSAVFIHILSIIQLSKSTASDKSKVTMAME